jgi:hypothetical protein
MPNRFPESSVNCVLRELQGALAERAASPGRLGAAGSASPP